MTGMLVALSVAVAAVLVVVVVLLARRPLVGMALLPLGAGVGAMELTALPGTLNGAHPLALAGVGCVVLHELLVPADHRPVLQRLPAAVAVAAGTCYAALVATSALVSPHLNTYVGITATTLLAIAYAGCIVLVATSVDDVRFLLGCLVVGSLGVTLPALLQAGGVESQFAGAVVEGRATGAFTDPNELGIFSALVVVASVVHLATGTGRVRWATGTAGAVALASLLLSFSRLSWIAATVGLLVLALHASYRWLMVRRLAPALVVGSGLAFVLGVRFPLDTVVERAQTFGGAVNPDDDRPLIWQESARLFLERPVLGWGPGAFRSESATPPSTIFADPVEHTHNGLLLVLVEQGVLGGIAVLALAAAVAWGLVSTYVAASRASRGPAGLARRPDHPGPARTAVLAWGLAAVGVTLVVNLTVDYALRNAFVMTVVWFLVGLLVAFGAWATDDERPQSWGADPEAEGPAVRTHVAEER